MVFNTIDQDREKTVLLQKYKKNEKKYTYEFKSLLVLALKFNCILVNFANSRP